MTPDNIRYFASTLHSSASIQDRVIHFGAGSDKDLLLEVPLGIVHPHSTIIITVGLDNSHPNTAGVDSDPKVGISDGTVDNAYVLPDQQNYASRPPCWPNTGTHDNRFIPGAQVPSTFKLTLNSFRFQGTQPVRLHRWGDTSILDDLTIVLTPASPSSCVWSEVMHLSKCSFIISWWRFSHFHRTANTLWIRIVEIFYIKFSQLIHDTHHGWWLYSGLQIENTSCYYDSSKYCSECGMFEVVAI